LNSLLGKDAKNIQIFFPCKVYIIDLMNRPGHQRKLGPHPSSKSWVRKK